MRLKLIRRQESPGGLYHIVEGCDTTDDVLMGQHRSSFVEWGPEWPSEFLADGEGSERRHGRVAEREICAECQELLIAGSSEIVNYDYGYTPSSTSASGSIRQEIGYLEYD
jgi:hypothetical protein